MAKQFHQSFDEEDVPLPDPQSTGRVFAVVFALIAFFFYGNLTVAASLAGVSAVLFAISQWSPSLLAPLNRAWFRLSLLMGSIVTPIVMLLIFVTVFLPFGLVMRLFSDPLNKRKRKRTQNREDQSNDTFWVSRTAETDDRSSMMNQF